MTQNALGVSEPPSHDAKKGRVCHPVRHERILEGPGSSSRDQTIGGHPRHPRVTLKKLVYPYLGDHPMTIISS